MLNLLNMDNLHFVFIFFIFLSSARLSLFFYIFVFILRAFHMVSVDFLSGLAGIYRETHTVTYMHVYIYMYIYMYNIKKRRDDIEYVHTGGSNGIT